MRRLAARISKLAAPIAEPVIDRIANGPRCPDCREHYARAHDHTGCLSELYDDRGDHAGWCGCKTPYGGRKPNAIERETEAAVA